MENIREILPKRGLVYQESNPQLVLCKPKLLPLKSVTLEKLEKMGRLEKLGELRGLGEREKLERMEWKMLDLEMKPEKLMEGYKS